MHFYLKPMDTNSKHIAGRLVLDSYRRTTPTGKSQSVYKLRCECGAEFETLANVVTKALAGRAQLRCYDCQRRAKLASRSSGQPCKNQPRTAAPPKRETLARKADPSRPVVIGIYGQKVWERLQANPARLRRVVEIVAEHRRAMAADGLALDLDRALIEAEEVAMLEEKNGSADDRWTRENRREGLQIVNYKQYTSPIGAF